MPGSQEATQTDWCKLKSTSESSSIPASPAGLWLRVSAATAHALFSAPCSRNTQIKLDTTHMLGEQLIPAQEPISPKKTQLAQHHQYCWQGSNS